jgi:hypothetical protein
MSDVHTPVEQDAPDSAGPSDQPPRTMTIVLILIAAALIVSYLCAYALTNALIAAELMNRWPPGRDPRPVRMCMGFVVMMSLFTGGAVYAQWASRRQLQRIDEMEQGE